MGSVSRDFNEGVMCMLLWREVGMGIGLSGAT